jgi:hypothetical protein
MRTIPPIRNASMLSIKITLHEKLALIPATPESPATLDGSLHNSQAMSDGAQLVSQAQSKETNRSITVVLVIFRTDASGLPGKDRSSLGRGCSVGKASPAEPLGGSLVLALMLLSATAWKGLREGPKTALRLPYAILTSRLRR